MNILILGGFLGSGKTSVLQHLAKYLVEKEKDYESDVKVAIVENEIGEIGIDDKILQSAGFNVSNIFAGCVCCSLGAELISGVADIRKELNPKWLIIESTGVAYPGSVRQNLLEYFKQDSYIVTIADAKRWMRLVKAMENLVSGQLEDSMTVLVNKADLISSEELENVKASILSYNSDVDLFTVSAIEGISEEILENIIKHAEDKIDGE